MLDERSRRRPGFTEGIPAELADGQHWTFPRVRLRLTPARSDDGRYGPAIARTVAGEPVPRMAEWIAAITAPPGGIRGDTYWGARLDAAATLLSLNYDLTDDDLARLLVWDEDDPASVSRWDGLDSAILGVGGPKPTPAI